MNLRCQLLVYLVISFGLCAASRALAQGFDHERLDVAFRQEAEKSILPAFGVVAVNRDGSGYEFLHGKAIWEGERPLTENSIFRIYSMTKPIVTVAAMQLVAHGKVSLDESLEKWLPEMMTIPILQADGSLVKSDQPITLRQLLTHTSGFAYTFTNPALAGFKQPADWPYKDGPRLFEPGASWNYGTGLDWVGRLVEKISGTDLETYLKKNVTGPLGMSRTFFVVPESLQDEIVSFGDFVAGETPKIVEAKDKRRQKTKPVEFNGGGGLFSTPHDYALFLRMVLNGGSVNGVQILQPQTIALMSRNQIGELHAGLRKPRSDKFGLGWAIDVDGQKGGRSPGTLYWLGAANTLFSIDPGKGRAVMLFTNYFPALDERAMTLFAETERLLYK